MKIALIGYGKMGRMIEEIAVSRGHEIVSIIDIPSKGNKIRLLKGFWLQGLFDILLKLYL